MFRIARRRHRVFLAAAILAAGLGVITAVKPASANSCGLPAPITKTHAANWYKAMSRWLGTRQGPTTVAAYDYVSGNWHFYHRGAHRYTASIVKADILETLLHQRKGSLTDYQKYLATKMIKYSDNTAATSLWYNIGSGSGLKRYNNKVVMGSTTPGSGQYWGLTWTTAYDQVKLVRRLSQSNTLLLDASRSYQLNLMRHVTTCQHWGVPYGVPSGVSVAVKNGWLPIHSNYSNWEVNTIGYVQGNGKRYLVAILSTGNPYMNYGVATVDRAAALTWRFMKTYHKPAPKPSPSPSPSKSPSPKPSPTISPTISPTTTPSVSPTDTPSPTVSPADSNSPTASPSETVSPTLTP
jgi:hypothetical protein